MAWSLRPKGVWRLGGVLISFSGGERRHVFFAFSSTCASGPQHFQKVIPRWCGRCGPRGFNNWEAFSCYSYSGRAENGSLLVLNNRGQRSLEIWGGAM
jgi:hypothetical protein